MEEIIRITSTSLTDSYKELYRNINGAIVKTILLSNSNSTDKEVSLQIDGGTFLYILKSKESMIVSSPIVSNLIAAKGAGIHIHISGIQLGG